MHRLQGPAGRQHLQQQDKSVRRTALAASIMVLLAVACGAMFNSSSSSRVLPGSLTAVSNSSSSSSPFLGVPLQAIQQRQQLQNPEQAEQLDAKLQHLRSQLSDLVKTDSVQRLLQGARLPKRVTLEMAQQLVVDAQLLQYSLQEGHAAARVSAIHSHYDTRSSSSSSSSSSRSGGAPRAAEAAAAAGSKAAAAQAALQEQQDWTLDTAGVTTTSSSSSSSSVSRGILIVGGSRTHLGNAYILLRMSRQHLHCKLPIEIVYYGPQELDPAAAALVRQFIAAEEAAGKPHIALIDGLQAQKQHIGRIQPHQVDVKLTSWVAKVHALCWVTSFQHVLFLDSDNLPVEDPEVLFDAPEFTSNGFLIWPDFWHNLWMEPAVYRLLNLSVPWEVNPKGFLAAESGQMLVDRSAHADVLEWLWLLNSHHELVYECVVGDKDTYRMAFELAGKGQHYVQVSQPPQELLGDAGAHFSMNRYFHLGMGQASPDGAALMFLHRTARGKFFPWCAAKRLLNGTCQPALLTLPAVQAQLEASVADAGAMRFDADTIDSLWHIKNCKAAAGDAAAGEGSSKWAMLLPVCSYAVGQLPIPALPPAAIPGLPEYLATLDAVFAEVQQQLQVQLVDRFKVMLGKL